MRRITVTLQPDEREALLVLAEQERRDPRAQAALLIRQQLEDLGLLKPLALSHGNREIDRLGQQPEGQDLTGG